MSSDLFGNPIQKRGRHYIQPRGYVGTPGTGPQGETCKTCRHLVRVQWSRSRPKCGAARAKWTRGRASDVLVRAPACQFWEKTQ